MDAMTVLALIAAILEFASSLLGFLTAIMERLPIRKDKEPYQEAKPPKRFESRGELELPAARLYYTNGRRKSKRRYNAIL